MNLESPWNLEAWNTVPYCRRLLAVREAPCLVTYDKGQGQGQGQGHTTHSAAKKRVPQQLPRSRRVGPAVSTTNTLSPRLHGDNLTTTIRPNQAQPGQKKSALLHIT